jgi:negative regulator of flagellin synthesis FlgM
MSGDNRIGTNAISGIARAQAARRMADDGSTRITATAPTASGYDSAPVASLISTARAIADQGPPVDMDRIASLKSAIADGSYRIDANQIASSMMTFFGRNG